MKIDSLIVSAPPHGETSYQTAPLTQYSAALKPRASDLFQRVTERIPGSRTKQYKGSFSVLAHSSQATAAKIVIYETGKEKINCPDPDLSDGIYILVRTTGGERQARTIGVAPKHDERFAYFRLTAEQSLDEMADFIAACADADRRIPF